MPTVAVVMATYNGGRWLERQLRSLAEQTRLPDVLVLSDDGSQDSTVEVARAFSSSAPFEVLLLEGPRKGLAANFWHAVSRTDCDLISWADQDDVWLPHKLAVCERVLIEQEVSLVSHSAQLIDGDGHRVGRSYPRYGSTVVLSPLEGNPWHVPSGFATMFVRSLVDGIELDDRPRSHQTGRLMNHDHIVSLRAFGSHRRAELQDELALYRQHDSNAAGDPTPSGLAAVRETFRPRAREFVELGEIAAEYGDFLGRIDRSVEAHQYFGTVSRRCFRRAAVYQSSHVVRRLRGVGRAARHGVYSPLGSGGFGHRALAKDLVASVALSRRED